MRFLKPYMWSYVKRNQFLPVRCESDGQWCASDDYNTYQKNLQELPQDWYYRHNPVRYKVNSRQYRTQEFDTIDWANSIVLLGCSHAYGVGVDEEHTISHFLQQMTGKFVVNLGVPGCSNNFILNNSMILSAGYPTPLAVIHMYTSVNRTTYYKEDTLINHGSWTLHEDDPYMKQWAEDGTHAEIETLMASKIINEVWKNKTKLIEATNFTGTHSLLKCEYLKRKFFKDYARDRMHFGFESTKKIAEQLRDKL